ncbi:MAG: hypothetical protein ACLS36_07255 [Streptococcus sp.]
MNKIEHTSGPARISSEGNRINGFSIDQVDEEIEKAKLITADDSYERLLKLLKIIAILMVRFEVASTSRE